MNKYDVDFKRPRTWKRNAKILFGHPTKMQCERKRGQYIPGSRNNNLGSELSEEIIHVQDSHVLSGLCHGHASKCCPFKVVPDQPDK